jgi:hypothetical protein
LLSPLNIGLCIRFSLPLQLCPLDVFDTPLLCFTQGEVAVLNFLLPLTISVSDDTTKDTRNDALACAWCELPCPRCAS